MMGSCKARINYRKSPSVHQHGGPSRPCQNCHSCMFGTKENSNLSICIQYLGNHSKTTCQKSAKSTRYRVRPKFKFYRKPLLSLPRQPLTISWIVLESPLFEWRENRFAPKCSYANIPYVKCSETLIISGSCIFLLPLPFELKFWFSNSNMWRDFKFKLKVSFGILWEIMVALLTIK